MIQKIVFFYYLGLREANSVSMDLTEAFCQPQSQGVALVSKAHQLQKAVLANRDATYFRWDFDNNTQSVSWFTVTIISRLCQHRVVYFQML